MLDLAMVLAAAGLLARTLWTPSPPARAAQLILVAAPLAFAIGGLTYLSWLLVGAPGEWTLLSIDFGILLVAWFFWRRRVPAAVAPEDAPPDAVRARLLIYALTAVVVIIAAAILVVALGAEPHGAGDALGIWNVRARFLYRNPTEWSWAVDAGMVHAGYPLLQPLVVARGWQFAGSDTTLVSRALAFVWLFLTLAWVFLTLGKLRGAVVACLAVLALLSIRSYSYPILRMVAAAASQLAETFLVFFMVAAACVVALAVSVGRRSSRPLVLAGVLAGCAAWTKNEGQLFAVCLLFALSIVTYRAGGLHAALSAGRGYLVGFAPLAALLWLVKSVYVRAPSSEFFARGLGGPLSDVADFERHHLILYGALSFGAQRANIPLMFCLVALGLSAGLTRRHECRAAASVLAVTAVLMAAGYYTIYLISPFPLDWLIATSMPRVFMQLWPMFILAVFVAIRTPAEVMADLSNAGAVRGSTGERGQLAG